MFKTNFFVFLFLICVSVGAMAAPDRNWTASLLGYGPIQLGMSRSQIEKFYGEKLDRFSDYQESCLQYRPRGGRQVAGIKFMLNKDRLVRIDFSKLIVYDDGPDAVVDIASDAGIGIGDAAEKIEKAYGKTASKTGGRTREKLEVIYTITSKDKKNLMRYFVDSNGKVRDFQIGRRREVLHVGNCKGWDQ